MADACEDCGRPFAADEAAFDAADEHSLCGMGPGCAGSVYHYDGFMLGACRVATIARLRAELSAAKEELAEAQLEVTAWQRLVNYQVGRSVRYFLPSGEVHIFGRAENLIFIGSSARDCCEQLGLLKGGEGRKS